jgi:hypothetical protein
VPIGVVRLKALLTLGEFNRCMQVALESEMFELMDCPLGAP